MSATALLFSPSLGEPSILFKSHIVNRSNLKSLPGMNANQKKAEQLKTIIMIHDVNCIHPIIKRWHRWSCVSTWSLSWWKSRLPVETGSTPRPTCGVLRKIHAKGRLKYSSASSPLRSTAWNGGAVPSQGRDRPPGHANLGSGCTLYAQGVYFQKKSPWVFLLKRNAHGCLYMGILHGYPGKKQHHIAYRTTCGWPW